MDAAEAKAFSDEITALYCCGPAGGGGAHPSHPQIQTSSALVPRARVRAQVAVVSAAELRDERAAAYDIAHARAGDKGNRLNIAVFPFDDGDFAALSDFLTEARVLAHFAHRGATAVRRYELPKLPALNFVIDDVLEGASTAVSADGHGNPCPFICCRCPWTRRQRNETMRRHLRRGLPCWVNDISTC